MRKMIVPLRLFGLACAATILLAACSGSSSDSNGWHTMEVTASAYTLAAEETDSGAPGQAAWGDVLKPGMKAIAVSRDLIKEGLVRGTKVKIEGLPATYTVLDKMARRWEDKIDILFSSRKKALEWGKKKVTIQWRPPHDKK